MNNKVHAIALAVAAATGASTTLADDACYTVSGNVTTINISETQQAGTIAMTLHDDHGRVAFSEDGTIFGNVTGTEAVGTTILTHSAAFPRHQRFVTRDDRADLAPPYVRATLDDGVTPCSYWIHEEITSFADGTRFFRDVSSVQIAADGYISYCPGENQNQFELSGELCKDKRKRKDKYKDKYKGRDRDHDD